MRQKFSMAMHMAAASAVLITLLAGTVRAEDIPLAPNVPDRYTVVKGDTLWGIAQKFLRDPWRWPDIWRLNREQIKNPHWIYPGDVVVLERGGPGETPKLIVERATARLSPTVRVMTADIKAIPSIPPGDIEPYLSRPLVTGPEGLPNAAEIVAGRDARLMRGEGDMMYAAGINPAGGDLWYVYRPGNVLATWNNPKDVLGYEQRFLGTAKVERFDEISPMRILTATQEILVGDKLIPAPREDIVSYAPHPPEGAVFGTIIHLAQSAAEAGRGWLVTIDKGAADGIDVGTVLAVTRPITGILDPRPASGANFVDISIDQTRTMQPDRYLNIADERIGLVFIYRVFPRVSFGILLNTTESVNAGDSVVKP